MLTTHRCNDMIRRILEQWRRAASLAAVLAIVVLCVACAPSYNVKPLPNFVDAAIQPGDSVEVTTFSGETYKFVVTEVTDKALHGEERRIPLVDIAELKKVAWKRPPSPCGGKQELGCSVPLLVSLASKEYAHYRTTFYDACAQHDYCYRHGARTYGLNREYCDAEFLRNMQMTCPTKSFSIFGTVVEILNDDVNSRPTCLAIADDFHMAARDFGEKHFQSGASSYCEYSGAP